MIHLTTFVTAGSAAEPPAPVLAYDALRPDGLIKELVARAAALSLVKGVGNADTLAALHDLLAPVVAAAVVSGGGVVNPVVACLLAAGAVNLPAGTSATDVTAALAGAVYDVVNHKPLSVPAADAEPPLSSGKASALFGKAGGPAPAPIDLDGLDLLSPELEPLRVALTRTLLAVRPDIYAAYRKIKDSDADDARERAYQYAFGLLSTLAGRTFGPGGI